MLQTRVSCTLFVARQRYQRGILRWPWIEVYITTNWDIASWCAAAKSVTPCFSFG